MMKRISLFLLSLITLVLAHAVTRQVSLNATTTPNVTSVLRQSVKGLNAADTVIIIFGKGNFYLNGNVDIPCNAVVTGAGRDKTVIYAKNTNDHTDDCFLGFKPGPGNRTSVTVTDLCAKSEPHTGLWWSEMEPRIIIKLYNSKDVLFERVDIEVDNGFLNNLDMRVCEDVVVRDCVIKNFNNCHAGGGLSLRGEMKNILVENCAFYKYGNDEGLTLFGFTHDAYEHDTDNTGVNRKENIVIRRNKFYAGGYEGKNPTDTVIDTYVTFNNMNDYNSIKNPATKVHHYIDGFTMSDNEFYVDVPIHNLITLTFDAFCHVRNVALIRNKIVNSRKAGKNDFWHSDIHITNYSPDCDTIKIVGNETVTSCAWVQSWGETGYHHIIHDGGNTMVSNNKLTVKNGSDKRAMLLLVEEYGGSITMNGNNFSGLSRLALLSDAAEIKPVKILGTANSFTGDTRITFGNVNRADINLSDNVIKSESSAYLLELWAKTGTLTFNRNKVTVEKPAGPLMVNWTGADARRFRFENVTVMGNTFTGVNPNELFYGMTAVQKRYVTRNSFF